MSSHRSTRSRRVQEENTENRQNFSQNKEQAVGNKVLRKTTTRAGRATKETVKVLKELTGGKQNSCKFVQGKINQKPKMVNEDDVKKQQNEENAKNKSEEEDRENGNMTEENSSSSSSSSDSSTDSDGEESDESSPNKKQRINDRESEKKLESEDFDKQSIHIDEKTTEPQECEEKDPTNIKATKTNSISLKSQNSANKNNDETSSSGSKTPKQLLTVISNLYLNVAERLHLDFPPRCLDDLEFCHRHHYRSDLPEAPFTSQVHSLRSALQHYRYVLFINATTEMCHRGQFPGKGIFTKVIELVLSINYATKQPNVNIAIYQQSYHKSIALFSLLVRTFPPCWHKMRPYYVGFFDLGLDPTKLKNNKEETLSKSSKIFDILLDLLEEILNTSEDEYLKNPKSETLQFPANASLEVTSPSSNSDLSMCSEIWNQNEYEEKERQKQTFDALPMDQKLERVFMALRLLLQILENDLAMWMLHHNKKTKEWIFSEESRPLIVALCDLTQYTRMTRVAKRIFSVYSKAASKHLCKSRLSVLERFISLVMVASNTADMENTAIGVKYPYLGDQTKTLIQEFFKIFKAHNLEIIHKYMETIDLLRIPYVRYEFIDNVLIMFQFPDSEPITPQKIALDIAKKRWLKYMRSSQLSEIDEDISREQYLHLLLDALRSYCEFHGLKTFLHVITDAEPLSHLTTTTDSPHRWPISGNGVLILKKMANEIASVEANLKMTVKMSKPKVELPVADICIDEDIIYKYRNDLKYIVSLQNVVIKQMETYGDVNFSEWIKFLDDFTPKKLTKEEPIY